MTDLEKNEIIARLEKMIDLLNQRINLLERENKRLYKRVKKKRRLL